VGGNVDIGRIEQLPLNGRQFANLAATIPGVGLGFHTDPTKSTQYSPQINGGNGRNVNYQIDGGDNNDDTVGGLLQLFPLEAIQEFAFVTSRSKAEYGGAGRRANIVPRVARTTGAAGSPIRDTRSMRGPNGETTGPGGNTAVPIGGSFGSPIVQRALLRRGERTQQDTRSVKHPELFPARRRLPTRAREPFTSKVN
jgi:hypothetical protein